MAQNAIQRFKPSWTLLGQCLHRVNHSGCLYVMKLIYVWHWYLICFHFQIHVETKPLNHDIIYHSETSPILSCTSSHAHTPFEPLAETAACARHWNGFGPQRSSDTALPPTASAQSARADGSNGPRHEWLTLSKPVRSKMVWNAGWHFEPRSKTVVSTVRKLRKWETFTLYDILPLKCVRCGAIVHS